MKSPLRIPDQKPAQHPVRMQGTIGKQKGEVSTIQRHPANKPIGCQMAAEERLAAILFWQNNLSFSDAGWPVCLSLLDKKRNQLNDIFE